MSLRHNDSGTVKRLDPVYKHGPIVLFKDVRPHLKDIVRPKPQEVAVERSVMQSAQRQSVSDERFSGWLRVCDDMSRV